MYVKTLFDCIIQNQADRIQKSVAFWRSARALRKQIVGMHLISELCLNSVVWYIFRKKKFLPLVFCTVSIFYYSPSFPFLSALALLTPATKPSACSATLISWEGCETSNKDGLFPMQLKLPNDILIFPEVYCEDNELTILKRTQTATESSFRDTQLDNFHFNQGEEASILYRRGYIRRLMTDVTNLS